MKSYWLVKSEPNKYSWEQFEKDGETTWDGVRNYSARIHLRNMKVGDLVLFYHSNIGTEIVGIAKVKKEAFPDPTATEGEWVAVTLQHYKKLANPVTLKQVKKDELLQEMALVKISRLSVQPVSVYEFNHILTLADGK